MIVRALALLVLFVAGPALAQPLPPPLPAGDVPPLDIDQPFDKPDELVFISPAGEPFRGPLDQPYPVAVWFARADKNGDGALTRDEFVADSLAFFDVLDTDKDGRIDGFENGDYEKTVAPEINGVMRRPDGPRRSGRSAWNPFNRGDALWGRQPMTRSGAARDRSLQRQGAAQYGLINEPHPVRGADADLDQRVSRAEAEAAARRRFQFLDKDADGRVTLLELPKTLAQRVFEAASEQAAPPKR